MYILSIYIHTCTHTYIHRTCIHHTYIHTCMYMYIVTRLVEAIYGAANVAIKSNNFLMSKGLRLVLSVAWLNEGADRMVELTFAYKYKIRLYKNFLCVHVYSPMYACVYMCEKCNLFCNMYNCIMYFVCLIVRAYIQIL